VGTYPGSGQWRHIGPAVVGADGQADRVWAARKAENPLATVPKGSITHEVMSI
jgi:hypothetical protein